MGNNRVYDKTGGKLRNIFLHAFLLNGAAAQQGIGLAVFVLLERHNLENNGLVDSGNYCDVPNGAVVNSECALLARNNAFHYAEVNVQVVFLIAHYGARLKDFSAHISLLERRS